MVAHGRHGGVPADAEGPGHLGDRVLVAAHPPADLGPGPLRQRRSGGDGLARLRPRPGLAVRLGAAPDPLGPHHHHRAPGDGQVPHLDPPPAVSDRPGAALRAAGHVGNRLHRQPPLAVDLELGADHEPGHAEQRRRAVTTVHHRQGPPVSRSVRSRKTCEALGPRGGPYGGGPTPTRPHASSRRARKLVRVREISETYGCGARRRGMRAKRTSAPGSTTPTRRRANEPGPESGDLCTR